MSKLTRQQTIIEIVSNVRISSQAALAAELKKRGVDVTQSTLSRDISELNLVKTKEGYTRPEDAAGTGIAVPDPVGTLKRLVLKVRNAQNLVVVRTSPGSAQQVALILDGGTCGPVVGTVAGDDTCLVVNKTAEESEEFTSTLLGLIG
jgi:transcriptional regulator of arginine metabolism